MLNYDAHKATYRKMVKTVAGFRFSALSVRQRRRESFHRIGFKESPLFERIPCIINAQLRAQKGRAFHGRCTYEADDLRQERRLRRTLLKRHRT